MDPNAQAKKKIGVFLAITLAISSVYYYLIISSGSLQTNGGLYVLGLMWAPGIAAIITQLIFNRSLRGLGWKPGKFKYLLTAFLLPLLYCLVVYGITWLSGLGGFPDPQMMQLIQERWGGMIQSPFLQISLTIVLAGLLTLPISMISALGEEIGWRGLFVPELLKVTTFPKAMLLSGLVWTLWHFPALFFADYNMQGAPTWYAGLMFAIMVISMSFIYGWLRLRSGSLWPAAILHASHNVFVQTIFTPLTVQNALTPYIIDEFGVGLALAGVVLAVIFWQLEEKQVEQNFGYTSTGGSVFNRG
jgi:uncharacterized protein